MASLIKVHTCYLIGTNLQIYGNHLDFLNGNVKNDFDINFDLGPITPDKVIERRDWVIVRYDDNVYPGEVQAILREEGHPNRYQVNVMHSIN